MDFLIGKRLREPTEAPTCRTKHSGEFVGLIDHESAKAESSRCMKCGTPFCRSACPLGNNIPECHADIDRGDWHQAYLRLRRTNPFPEFTGRVCPAPCESACTLGLIRDPVAIEALEKKIATQARKSGWAGPKVPKVYHGGTVAIVGSGPAGLAGAYQLNQSGFKVTVFERSKNLGGLLTNGIPNFKLDKSVVARRIGVLTQEGIEFKAGVRIGTDVPMDRLIRDYDAVLLATGATKPRRPEFLTEDRDFVWADHFLSEHTHSIGKGPDQSGSSFGKNVVVLGGGDTGSDCVGTANRQGAAKITQIEIQNKPEAVPVFPRLKNKTSATQWPSPMRQGALTSSQEEGCEVLWATEVKELIRDADGNLVKLRVLTGGEWTHIDCDLLVVAIGYEGSEQQGFLADLNIDLDHKKRAVTKKFQTSHNKVYAAGDLIRGANLVVQAIADGVNAAKQISADFRSFQGH
jgi:glutamate synthase (NADPH/NADH) small chain